jgi:hypothetical protein
MEYHCGLLARRLGYLEVDGRGKKKNEEVRKMLKASFTCAEVVPRVRNGKTQVT